AAFAVGCGTTDPTNPGNHPTAPTLVVDSAIPAAKTKLPALEDGAPRPVAVLTDGSKVPLEFVENEMLVQTADATALAGVIGRWNATIVKEVDPQQYGMPGEPIYLLRVQTAAADRGRLVADLQKLSPNAASQLRVSSDAGANLIAATAREKAD